MLGAADPAVAAPPPSEISVPGMGVFPESLTSSADGTTTPPEKPYRAVGFPLP